MERPAFRKRRHSNGNPAAGRAFRLARITDTHLLSAAGAKVMGVDPRAQLERVAASVAAFRPDLVLSAGDPAHDGAIASYAARRSEALGAAAQALDAGPRAPVAVVTHHPPAAIGSPWIHAEAFLGADRLEAWVKRAASSSTSGPRRPRASGGACALCGRWLADRTVEPRTVTFPEPTAA